MPVRQATCGARVTLNGRHRRIEARCQKEDQTEVSGFAGMSCPYYLLLVLQSIYSPLLLLSIR